MNSSMEANFPFMGLPWNPLPCTSFHRQVVPEYKPGAYDCSPFECTPEPEYLRLPHSTPQPLVPTFKNENCLDAPIADIILDEASTSYQRVIFSGQYFPRPDSNPRLGWGSSKEICPHEYQTVKDAGQLQPQDTLWDSFPLEPSAEYLGAPRLDTFNFFSAAKLAQGDFHSSQQVYTTEPHTCSKLSRFSVQGTNSIQKTVDLETELEFQSQGFRNSNTAIVHAGVHAALSKSAHIDTYLSFAHRGPMKRYRNLRNVANRPKMFPFELSPSKVYVPTKLEISGARLEEINQVPWDPQELSDGRRIVRIEARQYGPVIQGSFHMVGLAWEHPVMEPAPAGVDATEVSCLRYVLTEEGITQSFYYITSVELVNIIDTLINIKVMDAGSRRREKGRIRLNLLPYWLKNSLGSTRSIEEKDSADPRTQFARRISNYGVRKPRCLDKDVRVLSWLKLVPALQRAIQCYYTEIPSDEIESYGDE